MPGEMCRSQIERGSSSGQRLQFLFPLAGGVGNLHANLLNLCAIYSGPRIRSVHRAHVPLCSMRTVRTEAAMCPCCQGGVSCSAAQSPTEMERERENELLAAFSVPCLPPSLPAATWDCQNLLATQAWLGDRLPHSFLSTRSTPRGFPGC